MMIDAGGQATPEEASAPKSSAEEVRLVAEKLSRFAPAGSELSQIHELAKFSLETVTHLTEYEDEKANRILTAMAFLSALAAVVFSTIVQRFPLGYLVHHVGNGPHMPFALLSATYLLFLAYCILLTVGAAFALVAVRPRFNIPAGWGKGVGGPKSFLFFQKILEAGPEAWGTAFAGKSGEELIREYTKNCIVETYLIAQKIKDKLGPLQKGVNLFYYSTLTLLAFLVLSTLALSVLSSPESASMAPPSSNQSVTPVEKSRTIPPSLNPSSPGETPSSSGTSKKVPEDAKSSEGAGGSPRVQSPPDRSKPPQ